MRTLTSVWTCTTSRFLDNLMTWWSGISHVMIYNDNFDSQTHLNIFSHRRSLWTLCQVDWEGADVPPSLKSTKVIAKPVDHLDLSQPKSNQSLLSPRWHFKENLSFHQARCYAFFIHPVLKFLCPSLVKLWVSSREAWLKRSVCLLGVKAERLSGLNTGGRGLDMVAR